MKKCFTLFALLLQLQMFAQVSYSRYLNNSVKWTRTFSAPYHWEEHNYYVAGDTLIKGEWYYKVRDYEYINDTYSGNLQESWIDYYSMALREDSVKRFWRCNYTDTVARVWYDFNRPSNDSLLGSAIINTDTIYFDGEPRQRFQNETYNVLIEGIGIPSTQTSFSTLPDIMHCFFKDTAVYSYDGNCYIISSVDEPGNTEFKFYPNPASDLLLVETEENISAITVCDLAGKILLEKAGRGNRFRLDVSMLPRGIYLIRVKCGNNQSTEKLVLQ